MEHHPSKNVVNGTIDHVMSRGVAHRGQPHLAVISSNSQLRRYWLSGDSRRPASAVANRVAAIPAAAAWPAMMMAATSAASATHITAGSSVIRIDEAQFAAIRLRLSQASTA